MNVYNILCDSLGVEPQPNNGTLRLPLQPVGLHSDNDVVPVLEGPGDVNTTSTAGIEAPPTATGQPGQPDQPESEDEKGPTWWATLWGKVNDFKHWAGEMVEAVKDNVGHPA